MKKSILLAMAASTLFMSAAASAETYYVRNRPFNQVMTSGGEALVGTESFLRALGMHWTLEGANKVVLTDEVAADPALPSGSLTFAYGDNTEVIETSRRGSETYAPLRPLAKLAEFSVTANRQSGIVDVNKARMATADERKMASEVATQRQKESQAANDAWRKKVDDMKKKRDEEAAAEKAKGNSVTAASTSTGSDTAFDKNGLEKKNAVPKKPEKPGKPMETASTTPSTAPSTPAPSTTTPAAGDKPKEAAKEARLEVFRCDASPDYSTGTVTVTGEVKNMGDAPSKSVNGTLTIMGPDQSGSATNSSQGSFAKPTAAPVTKKQTWSTQSVTIPPVAAGASYQFTRTYRHPSGNSMPIGDINSMFKLSSTK